MYNFIKQARLKQKNAVGKVQISVCFRKHPYPKNMSKKVIMSRKNIKLTYNKKMNEILLILTTD